MFFSNRVVNNWNGLPDLVVESDSVNQFKNRIDKYFSDSGWVYFFFFTQDYNGDCVPPCP